jgi:hypothetical protein
MPISRLSLLYRWFAARAGRKAVFLTLFLVLCMNVLLFFIMQQILPAGGSVAAIPDLEFGYTADQIYTWLTAYGERGRSFYLLTALFVDMVYPIIYTLAFIFAFVTILENSFPRLVNSLHKYTFLPVLVLILDVIENSCSAILLLNYPVQLPNLVAFASALTQTKWLIILLLLTALSLGFIGYLIYGEEVKNQRHQYKEPDK